MLLLRQPEAARRLGISESFLEKSRGAGTGPRFVRLGRVIAYREEDLIAWVEACVVESTSHARHA
jgi:predicted DNA-binding transcriptional regulator AlpA